MAELSRDHAAKEADTLDAPTTSAVSVVATSAAGSVAISSGESARALLAHRYELLGLVGVGGMGSVYRARDVELDEIVALKVLRRELVEAPGMLERFRREAKLARKVTHRNVARVFDIGEHEGDKFLTMEFIDGESLASVLARSGALDVGRAVELACGIAAGLAGAHAAGVVHRDLKPDNVLLAKDGRVVVTDFGIARAFDGGASSNTVGMLLGTPAYMAPEQVEGARDIDARADVYALGAVLYELLTGQRAWRGDSPIGVAAARLVAPPPDPRAIRPDLPTACAEVVIRCMARKPEERYASVTDVSGVLSSLTLPAYPLIFPSVPLPAARTLSTPTTPAGGTRAPTPPAPLQSDKTVAILPFRNAGAPEDDYLAEELTDDLIDSLSMTRGLKVQARGAVAKWRGKSPDAREVGRELGVQVVVEGSVRKGGGNVRISARLISVADGFQLWAKRFDRPERDVLSINDDAAHAIAEALTLDRDAPAREAPSDPLAIDLFLRARHEYRKFWRHHQERAIELFDQALAIAPGDPMILAAKATAMARLAFFVGDGMEAARAVALQAVAAAPELAESRLALGSVLFQVGDMKGSVRELRHALAKNPGLAEAHVALGRVLAEVGLIDDAIRRLETAISIDPSAPLAWGTLIRAYALRGEWDRVEASLPKLREADGDHSYYTVLVRLASWRGDRSVAARLLEELPSDGPNAEVTRLFLGLVVTGKLPPALSAIVGSPDMSAGSARRRSFMLQMAAEAGMCAGDHEGALESLRRSNDNGLVDLAWLDGCPLFRPLHDRPEFQAVRAQVARRAGEAVDAYRKH